MKHVKDTLNQYGTLLAEIEELTRQIDALTIERKRRQMMIEEIEGNVLTEMESAGMKRAMIAGWKLNVSNSTRTIVEAEDLLPDLYWRTIRQPDLMRIKEALKFGEPVAGARLLIVQNISIKKPT